MNDDIETLLREAMTERTRNVVADPSSLPAMRARLRPRRAWTAPRSLVAAGVAAAVVGVALASAGVRGSLGGGETGQVADGGSAAAFTASGLGAAPFPAARFFPGLRKGQVVVVDAQDGATVAALPAAPGGGLTDAVLSQDGRRVYGTWTAPEPTVGYFDLAAGRYVPVQVRTGAVGGPTVSADGKTLAYEWSRVPGSPEDSTAVVVVDLPTGRTRVIDRAPAGPQILPLALSPDGGTLAVAPTNAGARSATGTRPLLLLPTDGSTGFAAARSVTPPTCGLAPGELRQPRWTGTGLYAYRVCDDTGRRTGPAVAKIDPKTGTATIVHTLPAGQILQFAVLEPPGGTLFVAADITLADNPYIRVLGPADGWSVRTVTGIDALTAVSAE